MFWWLTVQYIPIFLFQYGYLQTTNIILCFVSIFFTLPSYYNHTRIAATLSLHCRHIVTTLPLHFHHIAAILSPHCRHIVTTLPPHCRHISATLPPHCPLHLHLPISRLLPCKSSLQHLLKPTYITKRPGKGGGTGGRQTGGQRMVYRKGHNNEGIQSNLEMNILDGELGGNIRGVYKALKWGISSALPYRPSYIDTTLTFRDHHPHHPYHPHHQQHPYNPHHPHHPHHPHCTTLTLLHEILLYFLRATLSEMRPNSGARQWGPAGPAVGPINVAHSRFRQWGPPSSDAQQWGPAVRPRETSNCDKYISASVMLYYRCATFDANYLVQSVHVTPCMCVHITPCMCAHVISCRSAHVTFPACVLT